MSRKPTTAVFNDSTCVVAAAMGVVRGEVTDVGSGAAKATTSAEVASAAAGRTEGTAGASVATTAATPIGAEVAAAGTAGGTAARSRTADWPTGTLVVFRVPWVVAAAPGTDGDAYNNGARFSPDGALGGVDRAGPRAARPRTGDDAVSPARAEP
ncbi:MAG: hypothetical protein KDB56_03460 [Mycobacterium sp.]|nr:hypothetical protein [Mycobacterium sp.]